MISFIKRSVIFSAFIAIASSCLCRSDSTGPDPLMKDIFSGGTVLNETVMFLDYGQEKTLLFNADEIISVKSYDNAVTYREGIDYSLVDGRIKILDGSAIPCITSEGYYDGLPGGRKDMIKTIHDGKEVSIYWGEAHYMADWQVNVSYTHSDKWDGFVQPSCRDQFEGLLKKLKKGEDVTILFNGDSITHGCSSSMVYGYEPYQPSFAMLVAESLASAYGYRLVFTDVSHIRNTPMIPCESIDYGNRGTLRYINTAVGGWHSIDGVNHFDEYTGNLVKEYGCDLFVIGYGMNDRTLAPEDVAANIRNVCDNVLAISPEASLLLIATMLPNPTASNGWYGLQHLQEPELLKLSEEYRRDGHRCAVAQMTSVSRDVLKRKDFMDWSGNNINHPNDFFARIYAQTILRAIKN